MTKANSFKDKATLALIKKGILVAHKNGDIFSFNPANRKGEKVGFKHSSTGYLAVSVVFNGKRYIMLSHRVVWLAFNGLMPIEKQINHLDGNKNNNSLKNLELVSCLENNIHARKTGLNNSSEKMRGVKNSNAKFNQEQIDRIRRLYKKKSSKTQKIFTSRYLAKIYKTSHVTILGIVNKKTYI